MTSGRRRKSNQSWNKVAFKFQVYNVEQRHINVVYFNVDINNFRQLQSAAVIFNVEFHNVGQRRNNVVNVTIFQRLKKAKNYL